MNRYGDEMLQLMRARSRDDDPQSAYDEPWANERSYSNGVVLLLADMILFESANGLRA